MTAKFLVLTLIILIAAEVPLGKSDQFNSNSIYLKNAGIFYQFLHMSLDYHDHIHFKYRYTIEKAVIQKDQCLGYGSDFLNIVEIEQNSILTRLHRLLIDTDFIRELECNSKNSKITSSVCPKNRQKRVVGALIAGAGIAAGVAVLIKNTIDVSELKYELSHYKSVSSAYIKRLDDNILSLQSQNIKVTNYINNFTNAIKDKLEELRCDEYKNQVHTNMEIVKYKFDAIVRSLIDASLGHIDSTFIPLSVVEKLVENNEIFHNHILKITPYIFNAISRSILIKKNELDLDYDYLILVQNIKSDKFSRIYRIINGGWASENNDNILYYDLPEEVMIMEESGEVYPMEFQSQDCQLVENIYICNTKSIRYTERSRCIKELMDAVESPQYCQILIKKKDHTYNRVYSTESGYLVTGNGLLHGYNTVREQEVITFKHSVNNTIFIPYSNFTKIQYDGQIYSSRTITGDVIYKEIIHLPHISIPEGLDLPNPILVDDIESVYSRDLDAASIPIKDHFWMILSMMLLILAGFLILIVIIILVRRHRERLFDMRRGLERGGIIRRRKNTLTEPLQIPMNRM